MDFIISSRVTTPSPLVSSFAKRLAAYGWVQLKLSKCLTTIWQTLEDSFSAVSKPSFAKKVLVLVGKALDEIYQICIRPEEIALHLLNPIWKPRRVLLRSVIRGKNNAPAKEQADCSDAAWKEMKRPKQFSKCEIRMLLIFSQLFKKNHQIFENFVAIRGDA